MSYRLFEGVEVEGIHRGKPTLFVEGCVPMVHIVSHVRSKIELYEQIYFGASFQGRNVSPVELHSVLEVATLFRDKIVTLDSSGRDMMSLSQVGPHPNIHLMVTVQYDHEGHRAAEFLELMNHYDIVPVRVQVKLRGPHATFVWSLAHANVNAANEISQDKLLLMRL